ncbi:ABC transporter substrate-binding protein [Castellaniella sp.]|uniref:ABC transporter substrate-binding protein n=1 Tax=Castellaniella sp. TaxID=1955812 RepID=UPI00355E9B99
MKFKLLVSSLVFCAAMPFASSHAADDTIKVGAIFPLSGGSSPQGQTLLQGVQAMADLINEDGGVLGKKIVIIERDDEATPAVGVSRANDLIAEDVAAIVEGWISSVTLAMQPVISRANITDITASSTADKILSGEGNPAPVRINSSIGQNGRFMSDFITDKQYRKVAYVSENDVYGKDTRDAVKKKLEEAGYDYEVVADELFPFSESDFRVMLTKIKAANPDLTVIINANGGVGLPAFLRQAKSVRLPGDILAAVGTLLPVVVQTTGPAADGVYSHDIYFPDVEPLASLPMNQRFVAKVKERFDTLPDKNTANGGQALLVWAKAANETKSLDKDTITQHIRGGAFKDTVYGDVQFEDNGQMQSKGYMFQVEDGKFAFPKD